MGADDTKRHVTRRQLRQEIEQHARPGEIDVGDAERSQATSLTSDDFCNAFKLSPESSRH